MKHKTKLITLIIIFLLLIPFRLPISILMIELFNNIAQLTGHQLDHTILMANVVITKFIYNLSLSLLMVYNIEHLIRAINGRKAVDKSIYDEGKTVDTYWQTIIVSILLFTYLCFDVYWTIELFNNIIK